nr:serine/threonine-protein kinase atr isoform X1 [Ciona intestinalis]|eukprot:XP_009857757.1 serine/threonine-protein kinase atr isoform X1 [Ciona intestinalis]
MDTEQLLNTIVSDYKNILSLPTDDQLNQARKIRESLNQLIHHRLSNITNVKNEISKAKGQSSQTQTVLNFIHHLIGQFPYPVFVPSTSQCNNMSGEKRSETFTSYSDFLYYFMANLTNILSSPDVNAIHDDAWKLLCLLHQLIKTKNICLYKILLKKSVDLFVELSAVSMRHDQDTMGEVSVTVFSNNSKVGLNICTFEKLEQFQVVASNILKEHLADIFQLIPEDMDLIWVVSLQQLQHGMLTLKAVILDLLTNLLKNIGMPNKHQQQELLFCVVSILEYKSDDKQKNDFLDCGVQPNILENYDTSCVKFLTSLFTIRETFDQYIGSYPEPIFKLSFVHLKTLVRCVSCLTSTLDGGEEVFIYMCKYAVVCVVSLLKKGLCVDTEVLNHCGSIALALLRKELKPAGTSMHCIQFCLLFALHSLPFLEPIGKFIENSKPSKEKSRSKKLRLSLKKAHQTASLETNSKPNVCEGNSILSEILATCAQVLRQQEELLSSKSDVQITQDALLDSVRKCLQIFTSVHYIAAADEKQHTILVKFVDEIKIHDVVILLLKSFTNLSKIFKSNIHPKAVMVDIYSNLVQLSKLSLMWDRAMHNKLLVIHCTKDFVTNVCLFASILWMHELDWSDLKMTPTAVFTKKNMECVNSCLRSCNLDVNAINDKEVVQSVVKECLTCLSLVSGDICPLWRSQVIVNWGLNCENCVISCFSVSILPFLCAGVQEKLAGNSETIIAPIHHQLNMLLKHQVKCSKDFVETVVRVIQPLALVENLQWKFVLVVQQLVQSSYTDETYIELQSCYETSSNMFNSNSLEMFCALSEFILQQKDLLDKKLLNIACQNIAMVLHGTDKQNECEISLKLQAQWLIHFQHTSTSYLINTPLIASIMVTGSDYSEWNLRFVKVLDIAIRDEKNNLALSKYLELVGAMSRTFVDVSTLSVLEWTLKTLVQYLVRQIPHCYSTSYLQLESISADISRRQEVFRHHCRLIIETCVANLLDENNPSRKPLDVMEDLSKLFNSSLEYFITNNLMYLLPPIIVMQQSHNNKKDNLLTLLSENSEKSRIDMIMENFKHIFCHSVVSGFKLHLLVDFLGKETRIQKESLVLLNYGSLVQHLVAHLSVNEDHVCKALQVIQQIKSTDHQQLSLSQLLQPHILSILTFFNGQLRLTASSLHEKKKIIESLICLLKLMNSSEVSSVSVKIINTLCLAQQLFIDSPHASICCKAWDSLVRCVEKPSLGSMLSHVMVMLLPFLDRYPSEVTATLEFLVLENSKFTKSNFHKLYFLPEHQSLKRIQKFVEKQIKQQTKSTNLVSNLEQTLEQIGHESCEVRVFAIKHLRSILQLHQKSVQRHNLDGGQLSELMHKLIAALLQSCRDSNPQVRLLCAKSLGEIGALDPDKIMQLPSEDGNTATFYFSFEDLDFSRQLFCTLVQAFLVARPAHQDISAFALQELLKIYECKEGVKDTTGRKLWRSFTEQIRTVLEPHLSSRYMLKKQSDINIETIKRPIIHRKVNLTFREWIGSFCAVLMQMASSGSSVLVKGVFKACCAVVRNDINVALFILPHAVVEVLRSTNYSSFIVEEITAVLQSTERINSDIQTEEVTFIDKDLSARSHGSHLFELSAQAVFSILDHVTRWGRSPLPSGGSLVKERHIRENKIAAEFLTKIPQKLCAVSSLRCRAYARALLHFEAHLRDSCNNVCDSESATFLQRLFVEMDETDGVSGVVAVRGVEPTPETQLKLLESTGALQDASACYERIIQKNPQYLPYHQGYIKCLIDLGQLSTATNYIDGTVATNPQWEEKLKDSRVEACWRLGQWDSLKTQVSNVAMATSDYMTTWSCGIGRLLLAVRGRDWDNVTQLLDGLYQNQTAPLSAASMVNGSYQRGYSYVLRLHMLADLERVIDVVKNKANILSADIEELTSMWHLRLQGVQPSFRAREPILSLSRVALPFLCNESETSECKKQLGKLWLQSSKLARKSGYIQTAYGGLLSAQQYALPQYYIEHAKLLWQKGESHQALLTLQRGVKEHFSSTDDSLDSEQRKTRAKVMLLVAKLMEESSSFDSNMVLRKYKEVVSYLGEWEDSHFYCGKYYNKLMTTLVGENRGIGRSQHLYYIMLHYGESLRYGTSHIYESLTKLLTLWLDYGATVAKLEKQGKPQSNEDVQRLLNVISNLRQKLPAYIFYVAFSQLTSRVCHQHEPTYSELKEILVKVIQNFPQCALWAMMAISKSSYTQRATRCQEIFQRVAYKDPSLTKIVSDATKLTNQLLHLCNKQVANNQQLSINTHFKALKKLVEDPGFSEILLPLQKYMTATLPQTKNSVSTSQSKHNPFPLSVVHIVGFNDQVETLHSLQRPKKLTMRASDGSSHIFLCKPKDDLRKDARLTEFAAIVNKCLKRDPESGKRQLQIRTYAVVPLNEDCGIIEWVEHMKPIRLIILQRYRQLNMVVSNRELLACVLPKSAEISKKLDIFRNKLLPRHPPVFHEWFLSTFTNPSSWYNARLAYARSLAVMSMVGYILGLGDRHGENILFDSKSGEAMHVDFSCLFNKGQTLDIPEIVPFRLTHNLVEAMGPTKYEGFFRRACEVTMNVLREQREPLMSVLKTFIHDPLVEWSRRSRGNSSADTANEKALSHVNDIDKRLRGIIAKNKGLPLSIEGHVHYLIQEATDEEKLCQMYIGWAPFM